MTQQSAAAAAVAAEDCHIFLPWKWCKVFCLYRLEKQHMIPVRPRNHKQPMKRTTDRQAVAMSKNLKKAAVLSEESLCKDMLVNVII